MPNTEILLGFDDFLNGVLSSNRLAIIMFFMRAYMLDMLFKCNL